MYLSRETNTKSLQMVMVFWGIRVNDTFILYYTHKFRPYVRKLAIYIMNLNVVVSVSLQLIELVTLCSPNVGSDSASHLKIGILGDSL